MNSISKTILAAIAIVAAIAFYMSYFVVSQTQTALVLRFGDINRVVAKPGLYFKVPFADTVTMVDNRIMIWENNGRPVQDVASQVYIVDAFTLARVKDARLFRETLGADMMQAETRVGARLDAALRQTYGRRSFDAALSSDRSTMMREIRDQLRQEADGLGIEIVDVRVRRTDLSENVLDQTYGRMKSERNALAQDIRSQGEATKTRMNAETDRAVTEKLAQAKKEAEIVRGQGDAERNKVFAAAFTQDPEFFAFYRSMQAYQNAFKDGQTRSLVSPKSDFFRYFSTPTPPPEATPPAAAAPPTAKAD
jgi:membrane protease subunit HflC